MRSSIGVGLLLVALGLLFSFVATSLMGTGSIGFDSFASSFGAVLFLFTASVMLGIGVGMVIHWFADFANTMAAFIIKVFFGLAFFFIGAGLAFASQNWWLGVHVLFACVVTSMTLFILAFGGLVGGAVKGTAAVAKRVGKKVSKKVKARKK